MNIKVAVLISTFNGEKYINDLLKSVKRQIGVKINLFVIDDSSTDNTLRFIRRSGIKYTIVSKSGFKDPAKNFFFLIKKVPLNFDYYCFCDQDDVWLKNKSIDSIKHLNNSNASILGSRTYYTDHKLKVYSESINFKKKLSLENALVQSIAGGNTMIWTKKFQKIIRKLKLTLPASHDWMLYQLAMMLNHKFIFLKTPTVLYRQHGKNNIGANTGFINDLKRIYWGLKGRYKSFHELNKDHLFNGIEKLNIKRKNEKLIRDFYKFRSLQNPFVKLYKIIFELKIYRQTFKGNLMLILAIFLNKI